MNIMTIYTSQYAHTPLVFSAYPPSKHTDVVSYPVFLVLCNALCNPCHVSDFLSSQISIINSSISKTLVIRHTCSFSLTHAYTTACVNCLVNATLLSSISF